MENESQNRREFLKLASLALAFPLVGGCTPENEAQYPGLDILSQIKRNAITSGGEVWWGAIDAPANVSSRAVLANGGDRGEPIIVSGTVFMPDGKTPAPNVLIYLYHTDVYGIYGRTGEHKHGRFRGWMLTDDKGRYELRTIKPASYPNSTQFAHIHMTLTGTDFREDWADSILFEGDKFLTEKARRPERGGFNHVLTLVKGSDGIARGVRNIQLWQT